MADRTLEQFAQDLQAASGPRGIGLALKRLMAVMANKGQNYAQRNYGKNGLGVVTGNLKRSIVGNALSGNEGIGIMLQAGDRGQVVYAAVHEFGYGPRNIPARPYISPAIDHLRKILPKDVAKVVRFKVLGQRWTP